MARPSILTDALIADFCAKVRISGSIETAIMTSGVGRETYYGWARKVRLGDGNAMQKKFMRAVEQAEGEVKLIRESKLSKHFDKHWQSLAWFLERRFPMEYGQRRPPMPTEETETERVVERVVWRKGVAKTPTQSPAEDDVAGEPATD